MLKKTKMKKSARTLILASTSPRRQKLLREAGYEFEVVRPTTGELPLGANNPRKLAEENARLKAQDVARRVQAGIILAADTVVSLEGKPLGKPRDQEDAYRILSALSGTCHSVITGVALIDAESGKEMVFSEETFIRMRKVPDEALRRYAHSGSSSGKAGAYAIQEVADEFVEEMEGSFSNAVGLPMERLPELLREFLQTEP